MKRLKSGSPTRKELDAWVQSGQSFYMEVDGRKVWGADVAAFAIQLRYELARSVTRESYLRGELIRIVENGSGPEFKGCICDEPFSNPDPECPATIAQKALAKTSWKGRPVYGMGPGEKALRALMFFDMFEKAYKKMARALKGLPADA